MHCTHPLHPALDYPAELHARLSRSDTPLKEDVVAMLLAAKKIHDEAMNIVAAADAAKAENLRLVHENAFLVQMQQRGIEKQEGWLGYERRTRDPIGGILYYHTTGHAAAAGRQIGTDGCGDLAVIIRGSVEEAGVAAKQYLGALQTQGHILVHAVFVANHDTADGNPVQVVSTVDLLKSVGENKT